MKRIETDEARRLHQAGAQFVEVLPADEFAREHIAGACSIPLAELTPTVALDRERAVVTYCYDHECDLSARAASLLVSYGFGDVSDYAPSKTAWFAAGLPSEGWIHDDDRAGALADRTVATCGPNERTGSLGAGLTVVLDEDEVVLGVIDGRAATLPDVRVGDVMQTGPVSVRPSIVRHELAESMDRAGEQHVLVTTSSGQLVGLLPRERLDRA